VAQVLPGTFSIAHIIRLVADSYHVAPAVLTEIVKGPKKGLLARKVAMYMCQQLGGYRFGRNHETVWIVEYWVREFHHDADTKANQGESRILSGYSVCEAAYHKTRVLTHFSAAPFFGRKGGLTPGVATTNDNNATFHTHG
jgi:hypothetical protein